MDKFRFALSGVIVPSISEQPVKSLWKISDANLKGSASIKNIIDNLKEWLMNGACLPWSLSSTALNGNSKMLQLPFSCMKEYLVSRTRQVLLYRDLRDHKVAAAGIKVRTGRSGEHHRWVTWDNILWTDYYRVIFLIKVVDDGLPSPPYLHTWGTIL